MPISIIITYIKKNNYGRIILSHKLKITNSKKHEKIKKNTIEYSIQKNIFIEYFNMHSI